MEGKSLRIRNVEGRRRVTNRCWSVACGHALSIE
jgi:hypothetical protein